MIYKEIIDFEVLGNVIKLYLGYNGEQWGDDWDDAPYEHNAGKVYDKFVEATLDLFIPSKYDVNEICNLIDSSNCITKNELRDKKYPFVLIKNDKEKVYKYFFFGNKVPFLEKGYLIFDEDI